MSIATKHGDKGDTGLIGGERVSKADVRVEAYGTVDELGASMGFARSICEDEEVRELTKTIQRELFTVAGAVASPAGGQESKTTYVTPEMVEALTGHVTRIEATEGLLSDWSLPGEHAAAAAYDVAAPSAAAPSAPSSASARPAPNSTRTSSHTSTVSPTSSGSWAACWSCAPASTRASATTPTKAPAGRARGDGASRQMAVGSRQLSLLTVEPNSGSNFTTGTQRHSLGPIVQQAVPLCLCVECLLVIRTGKR